ncbi:hypothetical protein [Desulfobotulus mexicanus]|uniref:Uncharacterized protein n=1 Tax=Desulfobotulus mexicanus TaxID=2586642 RepID=A0A5Q4VBE4_9BACT|nr:hypothetical protein [Desulfobotulus mexicanus]TYT74875.1 hypothetical protein FIM25_07025 [Desulfobotulus mexicanus]
MGRLMTWLRERTEWFKWIFFAFLGGALVYDFMAERHDPHFFGDTIIGFWSVFALFGCLGMIVICKGISHAWLMKQEDYYDDK